MSSLVKTTTLFIIVLAIAAFFRLHLIQDLPNGLFPDEAANGMDAQMILKGHHTPFFERGNGREALYHYLLAVSIKLLGVSVFGVHLVSAIIGILTVLATFFMVKVLFGLRPAFLASFFLATSYWHVTLSRVGFRSILAPLFLTCFFLFLALTIKEKNTKKKYWYAALAGIFLGGGFYTYLVFRVIIGILGLMLLSIFIINLKKVKKFQWLKSFWPQAGIMLLVALIVLTPLIIYFFQHPKLFLFRAGHVSIFNPDLNHGDILSTFLDVLKKTCLSFFTMGDDNWRHNVSGFAFLNPLVASFFGIGFLFIISRLIKLKILFFKNREKFLASVNFENLAYFTLLLWFVLMLVPEVLTAEGIPHGLRLIGVIPAIFVIAALGAELVIKKIKPFVKTKFARNLFLLIGISLLFELVIYDYTLYFKISANSSQFYYAYRSDLTNVSKYLNERQNKEKTYLVLDEYSVQTTDFLTSKLGKPYQLLDPALSYLVELQKGDQVIFTQSTIFDAAKFEEYHPEAKLVREDKNKWGEKIMRVYEH